MADIIFDKKKETGSHYTPPGLARFVANKIWSHTYKPETTITVLDPACGDGELLVSFIEAIPQEWRKYINLIGVDSDATAFKSAQKRLQNLEVGSVDLRRTDFLELCARELDSPSKSNSFLNNIDIIIANPPYVRTQVLGAEKSQLLASVFNLSGRIDLYHAFIVAMGHCLKIDGIMGIITSNRFIATKSGNTVRELLTQDFDILELIDLGDTKLFEAAVLPAVLIARHREAQIFKTCQTSDFLKIYETEASNHTPQKFDDVYEALHNRSTGVIAVNGSRYKVTSGVVEIPATGKEPWVMVSHDEKAWLEQIQQATTCRITDLAKVRVGVKTTADKVFIREKWDNLPEEMQPESTLLYPLLSSSDTDKWYTITDEDKLKKILYTHSVQNGKRTVIKLEDYPKAEAYFEKHREKLTGRKYVIKANREWYEIWVPQNPDSWQYPKIVFPDISPEPQFLYDTAGSIVDGNCYWITLNRHNDLNYLFLIAGIANSRLMTRYHDLSFNNKLYSGRRRYLTQYVEKYPLPDIESAPSRSIINIVKQIVLDKPDAQMLAVLEQNLETAVMEAFNVTSIPAD